MNAYRLSDFDYHLPPELIAQVPAPERTGSRLLHVPASGGLHDLRFVDLPTLLQRGDLLVFNDSKVIPARLHAVKPTGGAAEILVERVLDDTQAMVMLKASKKPAPGSALMLQRLGLKGREITLVGRDQVHEDRFVVDFQGPVFEVLDQFGELPLPPYISHDPTSQDATRYQTVYAQYPGSVAAPTAGLHFDEAMLERLTTAGVETARVTLHVGSGTFSPVRFEDLSQHKMHSEWCALSTVTAQKILETKRAGARVIAVGTTSLRTLESWARRLGIDNWDQPIAQELAGQWETDLFITPGYHFRVVDALVTNFHLPKSTLLMLVSAFAGYERIRESYQHAIKKNYRFFSYGDAMCLERGSSRSTT